MLEVRDKSRPHLDQQSLQFAVRCPGNEDLVERIDDLLVIRDFVIDVRFVERSTLERLQVGEVLLATGFQTLAGWIVLRRDLELGYEVCRGFVDAGVVA